jgi:hypothetical protein
MTLATRTLIALGVLAVTTHAHARFSGIAADGCDGCHSGGKSPTITVDVSPAAPKPGETATVTVSIPPVNGGTAGFYLRTNGKGALGTIDGQLTRLIDVGQIVHSAPKAPDGGMVKFSMRWTAPATPGGVFLQVWGVAANGDKGRGGDGAGSASTSFAIGCTGKTYYRDWDGDGFGINEIRVDCSKPAGYVENNADCNDNDSAAHPGAKELCNGRDDNCNGEVDEDLTDATQYEDKDGDGYGQLYGKTVVAKCPPPGFASQFGDCDENDPKVHPGAIDVCDNKDNNCDGRVDEHVRPLCGVGWCAREAPTCDPDTCRPGAPKPEKCNGLDDNCDGEVDEGSDLCPAGEACFEASCVPAGSVPADPAAPDAQAGGCSIGVASPSIASLIVVAALVHAGRRRRRRR